MPAQNGPTKSGIIDSRTASDDEILGLVGASMQSSSTTRENGDEPAFEPAESVEAQAAKPRAEEGEPRDGRDEAPSESERMREIFEANPDLRHAWDDARAYRKVFATPKEAREATALIGDLSRLDALFFSGRPEDHEQLARSIAELDPAAFSSLAKAMSEEAGNRGRAENVVTHPAQSSAQNQTKKQEERISEPATQEQSTISVAGLSPEQAEFLQTTNVAAVQGVVDAIQSQVERLLPEGASKTTRNRIVGEIYRELDATLRDNRQLAQQVRDAFRSGTLDASQQRAIVSLLTGRARQALPGIAKKVMNEWTSTVLAANQDRRVRQRTAERRVDIVGSGGTGDGGRRAMTPREIDYSRLSDADILNL
jgi:hypothetical protein